MRGGTKNRVSKSYPVASSVDASSMMSEPEEDAGAYERCEVLALEVKFLCLQCGKRLRIDAKGAGAKVACPSCGSELRVPHPLVRPLPVATRHAEKRVGEGADAQVKGIPFAAAKLSREEVHFLTGST